MFNSCYDVSMSERISFFKPEEEQEPFKARSIKFGTEVLVLGESRGLESDWWYVQAGDSKFFVRKELLEKIPKIDPSGGCVDTLTEV